jgi:hypothetical protein
MSRKSQLPLVLIPKEIYTYIPLKEIQAYLPLVFDRIAPVMQIYPKRIVGGHSAIV